MVISKISAYFVLNHSMIATNWHADLSKNLINNSVYLKPYTEVCRQTVTAMLIFFLCFIHTDTANSTI